MASDMVFDTYPKTSLTEIQETAEELGLPTDIAVIGGLDAPGYSADIWVKIDEEDYMFRKWRPDFSQEQVEFVQDITEEAFFKGVEALLFISDSNKRMHWLGNHAATFQTFVDGIDYDNNKVEHAHGLLREQLYLIDQLRGSQLNGPADRIGREDPSRIRERLEFVLAAEQPDDPEGLLALPQEVDRIKNESIPYLLGVLDEIAPYIEKSEMSWVQGNFQKRQVTFDLEGDVNKIYEFDLARIAPIAGDIAHTIDMLTITRPTAGDKYLSQVGSNEPNFYQNAVWHFDKDLATDLIKTIHEKNVLNEFDMNHLMDHLAYIAITGMSMNYLHGVTDLGNGRARMSREFMQRTRLDFALENKDLVYHVLNE